MITEILRDGRTDGITDIVLLGIIDVLLMQTYFVTLCIESNVRDITIIYSAGKPGYDDITHLFMSNPLISLLIFIFKRTIKSIDLK